MVNADETAKFTTIKMRPLILVAWPKLKSHNIDPRRSTENPKIDMLLLLKYNNATVHLAL